MIATIHLRMFVRHEWDGNPLALEPLEATRPLCGVRTIDYPVMSDEIKDVTCKRCLRSFAGGEPKW